MPQPCIEPALIALFPRWTVAAPVVGHILETWPSAVRAVALAESEEEAQLFRDRWRVRDDIPLLLFHTNPRDSVAMAVKVVSQISHQVGDNGLGVLIADGRELPCHNERNRHLWNQRFSREVAKKIVDLQVLEYSASWAKNPPRIR